MTKLKLKNKRMIKRKPTVRKKKVGRPTKYRPEFCQQMIEWFDRELTILKEVEKILVKRNLKFFVDVLKLLI